MSIAAQTQLQGRLSWGGSGNGTGEGLGTKTRGEVTAVGMEGPGWCSLHVLESRIEGRGDQTPEGRRPCTVSVAPTLSSHQTRGFLFCLLLTPTFPPV